MGGTGSKTSFREWRLCASKPVFGEHHYRNYGLAYTNDNRKFLDVKSGTKFFEEDTGEIFITPSKLTIEIVDDERYRDSIPDDVDGMTMMTKWCDTKLLPPSVDKRCVCSEAIFKLKE
jgi:hypothetical protein